MAVKGLFIGITSIDIVYNSSQPLPEENEKIIINDFDMKIGGPAAKAAITCAELGGDAALITCLGDSMLAQSVKSQIESYNIKVYDLGEERINTPNISCVYVREDKESRTIISGINKLDSDSFNPAYITNDLDYCLYDCNLINLTPNITSTLEDNNIPLVLDCGNWKANIEEALSYSDIAISSACFQSPEGKNIFDLSKTYNINNTAITRDGDSILYNYEEKKGEIPVDKVENCNTSGAGDVLHGAFCYYYYHEKNGYVEALTNASKYATNYIKKPGSRYVPNQV